MKKRKAFTRDERKHQILTAFMVNIQAGKGDEMTLADIARYLDMSPSTKLAEMVIEVELAGCLTMRKEDIPGVCGFRRVWRLRPDTPFRGRAKQADRMIAINSRGKSEKVAVGQMELFGHA